MNKNKKILLFSDLEGTILKEEYGDYNKEDMYEFLAQIDRLQQLTGASVNIHLVSPIYRKQMEAMIDKIDRDIIKYNMQHQQHDRIPFIESGTFTPEKGIYEYEFDGDKAMPLKMPIKSDEFDTSRYGKANYVRTWCDMYKDRGDMMFAIYCGNGQNDLSAMKLVKEQKGFVVCPVNSRTAAKQKADFVSGKTDLLGIAEGLSNINKEIEKRLHVKSEIGDRE